MPGFSMGYIHCLPGFPEMAWPMMEALLDDRYQQLHGQKPLQFALLIEGVRESELIELMEQLQAQYPQVKVSSLPRFLEHGGSQIEMGVRGPSRDATQAWEMLQALLDTASIPYRSLLST
jgi:molybdopterin-biosynthesis enzyme MoeA-like protein